MPVRWTLPPDHSAASLARRHVGAELSHLENIDDIELVASELTTNAVAHGLPPVVLALESVGARVRLTVSSASRVDEPHPRHAADDESHGRGLAMIDLLALDWGWVREGDRLCVWADFSA